jgi:hypothetical protein
MVDTANNGIMSATIKPSTKLMKDGDGSTRQHGKPYNFSFFHEGIEFQPFVDANEPPTGHTGDAVYIQGLMEKSRTLRTVVFGDQNCSDPKTMIPDKDGCCRCRAGYSNTTLHIPCTAGLSCRLKCNRTKTGKAISDDGKQCVCVGQSYDRTLVGTIQCVENDWQPDMSSHQNDHQLQCHPCPRCAHCTDGLLTIDKGWRLNATNSSGMYWLLTGQHLNSNANHSSAPESRALHTRNMFGNRQLQQYVFKCPPNAWCPSINLKNLAQIFQNVTKGQRIDANLTEYQFGCRGGQVGALCESCGPHHRSISHWTAAGQLISINCTKCGSRISDFKLIELLLGTGVVVLVACVLGMLQKKYFVVNDNNKKRFRPALNLFWQSIRIVIIYFQVGSLQ